MGAWFETNCSTEREGWVLNNTLQQGGHRPTRFIGATEEIKQDGRWLSTFYAKDDELQDSST